MSYIESQENHPQQPNFNASAVHSRKGSQGGSFVCKTVAERKKVGGALRHAGALQSGSRDNLMDSSPHFLDDHFHPLTVNEDDDLSVGHSLAIKPAYDDERAKLEQAMALRRGASDPRLVDIHGRNNQSGTGLLMV